MSSIGIVVDGIPLSKELFEIYDDESEEEDANQRSQDRLQGVGHEISVNAGRVRDRVGPKPHQPRFPPTDPRSRWVGPEHLATVLIDDCSTTALVDGGAQVNVMTSDFLKKLRLSMIREMLPLD